MFEIFVVTLKVMENMLDYINLIFLKNDTIKKAKVTIFNFSKN